MDGTQMTIGGVRFTKGFSMMTPGKLVVPIGGFCSRFIAEVGIDDEAYGIGQAEFVVSWNGGSWRSGAVKAGEAPKKIDLIGFDQINSVTLEAVTNGDVGAHADWYASVR